MIFEGPEKKVELAIIPNEPSLRGKENFWEKIVKNSKAEILSKISNDYCDAYLLSESSLFVYDDCFTMITCGKTVLVEAVRAFLQEYSNKKIQSMIYERKNELFPHFQSTSFIEDAWTLKKLIPGKAFIFGNKDAHHINLFHTTETSFEPDKTDITLEVLMHGIDESLFDNFKSTCPITKVRSLSVLEDIFPNFTIDDHLFSPNGYSLNAIKDSKYYTIHVTPQKIASYISFETNCFTLETLSHIVKHLLNVFNPECSDIVIFHKDFNCSIDIPKFITKNHIYKKLSCGYDVHYFNILQPQTEKKEAMELPLSKFFTGDNYANEIEPLG